jgi:hypothetical protein
MQFPDEYLKDQPLFSVYTTDGSIKDSSSEGNHHLAIPLPSKLAEDPLPHHYCFSKGRHSGSFYLKVGAAGECSLQNLTSITRYIWPTTGSNNNRILYIVTPLFCFFCIAFGTVQCILLVDNKIVP